MFNRERRKAARYVVGGLMLDINGILHETLDVSSCAVALVKQRGCDYAKLIPRAQFSSDQHFELNQSVTALRFITQRSSIVVLGYEAPNENWEATLKAYDVRADMKQLEDVFG